MKPCFCLHWECMNCKYRHTQEKRWCLWSSSSISTGGLWTSDWLLVKIVSWVRRRSSGSREREVFVETYVGFFSFSSDNDWWRLVSLHLSLPWFSWQSGEGEINKGWAREGRGSWCGHEMLFLTVRLTMSVFSRCTGILRATLLGL